MDYSKCKFIEIQDKDLRGTDKQTEWTKGYVRFATNDGTVLVPIQKQSLSSYDGITRFLEASRENILKEEKKPDVYVHFLMQGFDIVGMLADSAPRKMI